MLLLTLSLLLAPALLVLNLKRTPKPELVPVRVRVK